ncbi:predicted protein [Nematostella vectensis]|uniref:Uncharacterized protein n=1 Tax=Nematostella vectensis TaxID=45351 RepID=A7S1Y2_NEMVE|nr:predicted protein [Nematostella vectensis]|eukprot:XP_001634342.1 predicted protein [Nematostella vectensis]
MSQNNRRNRGPAPTGSTKASKIREMASALDYASHAIRSLNKELRKLGAENDVLETDVKDGNQALTENQKNVELILKKQDKSKKQAKLQELKLQRVFVRHLLNGLLEKVLAMSAPALAEREQKDLQSFCDRINKEKEAMTALLAEQTKKEEAKIAFFAELKRQLEQAKISSKKCTAESQTSSPSTTSMGTECTTECAEVDVQTTSEVTMVSAETQTDAVPEVIILNA